jgi:2-methylisocitrate lyase-like PEP mutase family enzyme
LPRIDLTRFAEHAAGVRDIMGASTLPVLVDADGGSPERPNVPRNREKIEAAAAARQNPESLPASGQRCWM